MHHIPMLTPFLAWLLIAVSAASLYFHWYNRNHAGWLLDDQPNELVRMAQRGEDHMGWDCLIMGVGMGLHNLNFLPPAIVIYLGLAIILWRIWVLVATIGRSVRVYRFRLRRG